MPATKKLAVDGAHRHLDGSCKVFLLYIQGVAPLSDLVTFQSCHVTIIGQALKFEKGFSFAEGIGHFKRAPVPSAFTPLFPSDESEPVRLPQSIGCCLQTFE